MIQKQFTPGYLSPLNGAPPLPQAPKRGLVATRTSTDEQAEDDHYSVPEQERKGREHFEAAGIPIVGVVHEDFTGATLRRPGFQRIVEMARRGEFEILAFTRTSRLARKAHLQRQAEELLGKYGVEVRYVDQRFDESPTGDAMKTVIGAFDELQWADLRKETMEKREAKAKGNEKRPGAAPSGWARYGYHQITVAEAATIEEYYGRSGQRVIIEEEAAVVRRMFELSAAGLSTRGIARWLRDNGHRTRGENLWSNVTIREVLRDEQYAGTLRWGKQIWAKNYTPEVDPDTGKKEPNRSGLPRPLDQQIPIAQPAIISMELFSAVQEQLARGAARAGRPSTQWLLTGCLYCADCRKQNGDPFPWAGGSRGRYGCSSRHRFNTPSCNGMMAAEKLEQMALTALKRIADPDWLEDYARKEAAMKRKATGTPAKEAARLRKELDQLQEREVNLLWHAQQPNGPSSAAIQEVWTRIADERARLERNLAEAERQLNFPDADAYAGGARLQAEYLSRTLEELGDRTDDEARQRLRALFRTFLEITVSKSAEPKIRPLIAKAVRQWKLQATSGSPLQFHDFERAETPLDLPLAA